MKITWKLFLCKVWARFIILVKKRHLTWILIARFLTMKLTPTASMLKVTYGDKNEIWTEFIEVLEAGVRLSLIVRARSGDFVCQIICKFTFDFGYFWTLIFISVLHGFLRALQMRLLYKPCQTEIKINNICTPLC